MTSINALFGLTHPLRRVAPEEKIEQAKKNEKPAPNKTAAETSTVADQVSISTSGKNLLLKEVEVAKYLNQIQGLMNLDEESIKAIRERIEEGHYDGPAVIAKIIADIIAPPPYTDLIDTSPVAESPQPAPQTDLEEIQNKIQKGEYFREEVTEVIAEKLLETDYI